MRLHRFYLEQSIEEKTIKVESAELIHQWKNVFRYQVGTQVIVFCGDGYDYLCMLTEIRNHSATLEILSKKKSILVDKDIALAVSLIKKDNMELIVQKVTELGVSKIFPVISERSEKKSLNLSRARKIAIEAAEQSGRGDVPEIFEPMEIQEFFDHSKLQEYAKKIVFTPKEEKLNMAVIENEPADTSFLLAIGPEGGFSETEIALFSQNDFKRYSLGNLILRAETAAIAALSLLLLS